jgi:glycosyltransferase involved in cell wall biosynthesis
MINEISVLITTFNSGKYLQKSLESILNQTYKNYELLIIDDGSTDNTEEIVNRFKDSRVRYIKSTHLGLAASLNYGLRIASNDWVVRMDADDICSPRRLEKQLEIISNNENQLICSWSAYFKGKRILYTVETPKENERLKAKLALHSYICHSSVVYNRKFILQNGGYNESLSVYEDYDLWLRIKDNSEIIVIPEYLLYVRLVPTSLSRGNYDTNKKIVYGIQKKYYNDLSGNFNVDEYSDQLKIRGWREYFYGDKNKVISNWAKVNIVKWNYKMVIASFISLMPNSLFNYILKARFRLRMIWLIRSCFGKNNELKTSFQKFVS